MKIAIAFLLSLLGASAASASAAEIASIDFDRIKSPLTELVLAKPENLELKEKFDEAGGRNPLDFMENMDFSEDGGMVFDADFMKESMKQASRFEIEREVDELLRRELVLIIDRLDGGYDLIVSKGNPAFGPSILYARVPIEDITQKIYQVIVRALAGKPDRQSRTR